MGSARAMLRFLVFGAITALAVALAARLWDEFAEETQGADDSEQIELDRTVQPGISVRS